MSERRAYLGNEADVDPSGVVLPQPLDVQVQELVGRRIVGQDQNHRPLQHQAHGHRRQGPRAICSDLMHPSSNMQTAPPHQTEREEGGRGQSNGGGGGGGGGGES